MKPTLSRQYRATRRLCRRPQGPRPIPLAPMPSAEAMSQAEGQDIAALLSRPVWSVRSLLPTSGPRMMKDRLEDEKTPTTTTVAPLTLHHLLRLSALPQPVSPTDMLRVLRTLRAQLNFVQAIREVDTTDVEPLRAIRDETEQGVREQTIGLEQLKDALAREDVTGHARCPKRRPEEEKEGQSNDAEDWDPLDGAGETAGRYFVVRSGSSVVR
ncbi:hypothetical protein F4779DRAFT_444885 [Xylariaceae sp. FL0662B]|nr:hypothetical protein F4779DRAFT_444885 [Xylariaceae sp. FL0662B]